MASTHQLTQLLLAARSGQDSDHDALFAAVYSQLRQIAARQRRKHAANSTLHTTALVHESYLRLVDRNGLGESDRLRFFSIAAGAMRQILVDHYRSRNAAKRGGGQDRVDLEPDDLAGQERGEMLLALDEALRKLEAKEPRQARVVELRFFVGLTEEEIGSVLGVSDRTVRTDWTKAKKWLADFLGDDEVPRG